MSRLIYKGDTIESFGQFLPTPIIENITIENINSSDSLIGSVNDALRSDEGAADLSHLNFTKLKIKTSVLFNSDDMFKSEEFFQELLYGQEPLYLNIFISKQPGNIELLKSNKLSIRDFLGTSSEIASLTSNSPYHDNDTVTDASNSDYVHSLLNNRLQVYSIPFSSFKEDANFSSDFDDNGNAVLKSGFTSQIFHVLNMNDHTDITIFATVSANSIENIYNSNLSNPAVAINFSDITYEDLKINGRLAKFGDPVFVDQNGLPYSNTPLQSIDGRFFKSDNVTHNQIKKNVRTILNRYESGRNPAISSEINNYSFVLETYGDTVELLPRLKKLNSLSPSKSSTNNVGLLYDDMLRFINSANSAVISGDLVAKRIYRNYKIQDFRQIQEYNLVASYQELRSDDEIIYAPATSNVAKYVPIAENSTWPGSAEVPIGSAEFKPVIDERIDELKTEIEQLILSTRINRDSDEVVAIINSEKEKLAEWLAKHTTIFLGPGQRYSREHGGGTGDRMYYNLDSDERERNQREAHDDDIEAVGVTRETFWETWWWMCSANSNSRPDMYELVFPDHGGYVDSRTSKVTSMDTPPNDANMEQFYKNLTPALLEMRPPIHGQAGRGSYSLLTYEGVYRVQSFILKYQESAGKNWDADLIMDKFLERIGSYDAGIEFETENAGIFQRAAEGNQSGRPEVASEIIDHTVESVANELSGIINRKISSIRSNPRLMNSLAAESNLDALSEQLWNTFWANAVGASGFGSDAFDNATGLYFTRLGSLFDGYIRTPFVNYPDAAREEDFAAEDRIVPKENLSGLNRVKYKTSFNTYNDLNVFYGDYTTIATKNFQSYNNSNPEFIYRIALGNRLASTMANELYSYNGQIKDKIREILRLIQVRDGFELDTGVHDTLANFDITIRKDGFFFLDIEKYIRKHSFMSRYMNVDSFLNTFDGAYDITNNAIFAKEVEYYNHTYLTGLNLIYDSANYDVTTPTSMNFSTKVRSINPDQPIAYFKAPYVSMMTFQDFMYVPEEEGQDSIYRGTGGFRASSYDRSSKIVQRNYAFPLFNDDLLSNGKTWFENYRMGFYAYNFFIDDDLYNKTARIFEGGVLSDDSSLIPGATTGDAPPTAVYNPVNENSSIDVFDINIKIKDRSYYVIKGMADKFKETYDIFIDEYYNPALENCSFNEYTQRFNNFFASAILEKYPDGSPWFNMVSTYFVYLQIFTDSLVDFAYEDILELAEKINDTIRPETGSVTQLMAFDAELQVMANKINFISSQAKLQFLENDLSANYFTNREFTLRKVIETPVFDHIGDYTVLSAELSETIE